ncbi:MAG: hypothetical protein RI995_2090 [Bacteroidota bacterium]
MLKVYGIPNCNTMKKAFDYLQANNIPFEFHDYKKKGLSIPQLEAFLDHLGAEIVLNKQGSTYKQLNDEVKGSLNTPDTLKSFLLEKTSAIKRPIFEKNGRYLAGFDTDKLDSWLTI